MSIQPGRVARARIVASGQLDLFDAEEKLVRNALKQGRKADRYGRLWHLGQVTYDGEHLYGRLGFDRTENADLWQNDIDDFENLPTKSGAAAPFVVRMVDLVVVYQPRRQAIRPISFVGALRSMLRMDAGDGWNVTALPGAGTSFDDWRQQVDQVTQIRFRLDQAPGPEGHPSRVASLLSETKPESAMISWRSEAGLDLGSDLMRDLMAQAESGAGEIVAFGRSTTMPDALRRWDSAVGDENVTTEVEVNETGEVDRATLLGELAKIGRLR
ncbi:hypothetical protein ACIA8K_02985 [Catenuloplanes sp. NPDC051500]|uniref:hypothetical protein n=1 Tax=Catenuloplanes sp. NPDC051500 TaxID=3363959 RepID=UPI0037B92D95